jgi:hypothetical protein
MPVHLVDPRLGEKPARDAGLVRGHHDRQPRLIQPLHGRNGPRVELHLFDTRQKPDVLDERAVTIQEHGGPPRTVRLSGHHNIGRTAPATRSTPIPRMHR